MSRSTPVYSTSYTNMRPQRFSKRSTASELVDRERRFAILVLVITVCMFISIPFILMYKRKRVKSKSSNVTQNVLGSIDTSSLSSATIPTLNNGGSTISNDNIRQTVNEVPMPNTSSDGLVFDTYASRKSSELAYDKNKLHNIIDTTDAAIRPILDRTSSSTWRNFY